MSFADDEIRMDRFMDDPDREREQPSAEEIAGLDTPRERPSDPMVRGLFAQYMQRNPDDDKPF